MSLRFELTVLADSYAILRLDASDPVPPWAMSGPFSSVTRTETELSIVCVAGGVPDTAPAERDYQMLRIEGPLDLAMVGVMAEVSRLLAAADCPLFVLATHDTDYFLVPGNHLASAAAALTMAGHSVVYE